MITETSYGLSRKLSIPYEEALPKVKDALSEEGFGVLTEIDCQGDHPREAPDGLPQVRHNWRL